MQNKNITELNLGECMIGDLSAIGIFNGLLLKQKQTLKSLNLRCNHLTDKISPNLSGYLGH